MNTDFDFIIVGSGAGGAPLAARLAERGFRVLVIEAGPRNSGVAAADPAYEVTEVPAFHGSSTERPEVSWEYPVDHFDKPPTPNDSKFDKNGFSKIFYPRATGIGGCTIHNAMITILGPDADWDEIAELTGDASWRGSHMRAFFERLERCQYLPRPTGLTPGGWEQIKANAAWLLGKDKDPTGGGHGFDGWLATSQIDFKLGATDVQLLKMLTSAAIEAVREGMEEPESLVTDLFHGKISGHLDPNNQRTMAESPEGLAVIPVAIHAQDDGDRVRRGHRSSPRERLLDVERRSKAGELKNGRLEIWTDCLVHRVIIEKSDGGPRATGVEFERGRALYKAAPKAELIPEKLEVVSAKREVILSGGAFNTPQLLMLSGVGDEEHLKTHGIKCIVNRPGVGGNLQDRYEVTVVSEMNHDFSLLADATFNEPDPGQQPDRHLAQWQRDGSGIYTTNGAVLGIFKRSRPDLLKPDLFIFGVPLPFHGYAKGYSKVGHIHNQFTWAILKSHTRNRDGTVRLRSSDPRDTPLINFHNFQELARDGEPVPDDDPDLAALVEGVKFVRRIARGASLVVKEEVWPGAQAPDDGSADADRMLREFIIRETWGHHASCTCPMGLEDNPRAVLDGSFRVHGVSGLRVVDASVFPRIPGYFIVSNIYMISEKAADVIAADNA